MKNHKKSQNLVNRLNPRCMELVTPPHRQSHHLCKDDIKNHQKLKQNSLKRCQKLFLTQSNICGFSQSFCPAWFLPSTRGQYWWEKVIMETGRWWGPEKAGWGQKEKKKWCHQVEKEIEERMAAAAAAEESEGGNNSSSSLPQKVTNL